MFRSEWVNDQAYQLAFFAWQSNNLRVYQSIYYDFNGQFSCSQEFLLLHIIFDQFHFLSLLLFLNMNFLSQQSRWLLSLSPNSLRFSEIIALSCFSFCSFFSSFSSGIHFIIPSSTSKPHQLHFLNHF